jgi:predicted RNA-binding protein YlxR (DUF448 family)
VEEQAEMGLTDGLIRFSIGLDNDIKRNDESMHGRAFYIIIFLGGSNLIKTV